MIKLDAIKKIPDDKPRKGPARMSKSEKCEARRRYKEGMRVQRMWAYSPPTEAQVAFSRRIRQELFNWFGVPEEYLYPQRQSDEAEALIAALEAAP